MLWSKNLKIHNTKMSIQEESKCAYLVKDSAKIILFFQFKCYNLLILVVKCDEIFHTIYYSSIVGNLIVKSGKRKTVFNNLRSFQ